MKGHATAAVISKGGKCTGSVGKERGRRGGTCEVGCFTRHTPSEACVSAVAIQHLGSYARVGGENVCHSPAKAVGLLNSTGKYWQCLQNSRRLFFLLSLPPPLPPSWSRSTTLTEIRQPRLLAAVTMGFNSCHTHVGSG